MFARRKLKEHTRFGCYQVRKCEDHVLCSLSTCAINAFRFWLKTQYGFFNNNLQKSACLFQGVRYSLGEIKSDWNQQYMFFVSTRTARSSLFRVCLQRGLCSGLEGRVYAVDI